MYFLAREGLKNCQKIVIKIGSNALVNENGFNQCIIESIAQEIAMLVKLGKEIVLITSGAVALGKIITNTTHLSKNFYATIGQKNLMHEYDHCFEKTNHQISQLLLTKDFFNKDKNIKQLKNIINESHSLGITTIINENDAISNNSFNNNDLLAAEISKILDADLLVLLTNTNGIYKCFKKKETISQATIGELKFFIQNEKSSFGTGGMDTKLTACAISGTQTVIANAFEKNVLTKITNGKNTGTLIIQ